MVRATDRHTSGVYRHGCRDGAAAAQFLSLNDKTIVQAMFDSTRKAGRATLACCSPSIDCSDKRRFFAALHVPPVTLPLEAVRAAVVAEHNARDTTMNRELKPVTFTDLD
jgi:hypothetical protein